MFTLDLRAQKNSTLLRHLRFLDVFVKMFLDVVCLSSLASTQHFYGLNIFFL